MISEKVIILKSIRHGDADLIVHVLTPLGSKLSLFAKSALKSTKRFGGGMLEPSHCVQVIYKKSTTEGAMGSLREATLIDGFTGLRSSYEKLELAFHFLRTVEKVSHEEIQDSENLFGLLAHSLKSLETSEQLHLLKLQFELKLLSTQGVLESTESVSEWLKKSLHEHDQFILEPNELERLQHQVARSLSHYLG